MIIKSFRITAIFLLLSMVARVHYTLVTLAVLGGLWWADYWNLLGFRM